MQSPMTQRHQFDQNIHGRSGGILKWIAYGIADHGRFMVIGTFSAEVTFFNVLFGVIQGTAAIGHKERQEGTHDGCADEHAGQSFLTQEKAHRNRGKHGDEAGFDHLFKGGVGGNGHAGGGVSLDTFFSFQESWNFPELTTDFLYNGICRFAHGGHGQGRTGHGDHAADEQADDDLWVIQKNRPQIGGL